MSKEFYKVDGHSNLVKNPVTGVILNVNTPEITRAKKRKSARIAEKESQQEIVNEVNQLRSDMDDIKSMLQQLIEK